MSMSTRASPIVVRSAELADCAGIARVHVDTWRTTYQGIVPQDVLDELSYSAREQKWKEMISNPKPGESNFIAQDASGSITGFSCGGPERDGMAGFTGELYAIYLLQSCQRQGTGRRLVAAVVADLIAQARFSMLVWVLAANPADAFYQGLGKL